MKTSLAPFFGSALLLWTMAGCSGEAKPTLPATVAELRDAARGARDDAAAAREARLPKDANAAAERAEAAAAKAAELLAAADEPPEADRVAGQEATLAARQARRHARLAEEDQRLAGLVNGWKGKAYRATRNVTWPAACNGLALAADQAEKVEPEKLPPSVRDAARSAADVAGQYTGRAPKESGDPDWPGVAADLRQVASSPPPEMIAGLALVLALGAQRDIALYEIELLDPATLTTNTQKTQYHLVKGLVYSVNDLPLLAGEQVGQVPSPDPQAKTNGPELLAGIHLCMAAVYLRSGDYEPADRHTVLALQACPNNPLAVFLTGERLAATGEYEKAAHSLEAAARGTDGEWLAERVATRARELRDKPGDSATLLHDTDFLWQAGLHYLADAAKRSKPAEYVHRSLTASRSLADRVLEHLPGSTRKE